MSTRGEFATHTVSVIRYLRGCDCSGVSAAMNEGYLLPEAIIRQHQSAFGGAAQLVIIRNIQQPPRRAKQEHRFDKKHTLV